MLRHIVNTSRHTKVIQPCINIQRYSSTSSFDTNSVADKFNLSPNVLTQALTHKSFSHGKEPSNERLEYVGRRCIEFFATEANISKKAVDIEDTVKGIMDKEHLVSKFDSLNIEKGVRCTLPGRIVSGTVKQKTLQALVGAVYHERGLNAAKEFTTKYVL
ncbi:ribonuclease-III-like-domain-containing protein [Pilobolus umbonatus]|nr:ribonuclease-III-like-domain-containing protein [Pilobolus umbonatus]